MLQSPILCSYALFWLFKVNSYFENWLSLPVLLCQEGPSLMLPYQILRETPGKSVEPQLVSFDCTSIERQGPYVVSLQHLKSKISQWWWCKYSNFHEFNWNQKLGPLNGPVVGVLRKPCMMLLLFSEEGSVREILALKRQAPPRSRCTLLSRRTQCYLL